MSQQAPVSIDYSIVIPCYRSGAWLEELVTRLELTMAAHGGSYEILLVNDASPDDLTWRAIQRLADQLPTVCGFDLMHNTGQFRATVCGLEHARGEIVVLMDDDLQHQPEDIPALIHALENEPDFDCAMARFPVKHHRWHRRLGSRFASWLFSKLFGKPRHLSTTSFRAVRRELAEAICAHRTMNPTIGPLLYQTTARIKNVTLQHQPRPLGRSGYNLAKLIAVVWNAFFSASTFPLRVVAFLGICSSAIGAVLGCYYLTLYLIGQTRVPGFTTLALLLTFFGGMSLFGIGLLGEYQFQILQEVRSRPRYVVRSTTDRPRRTREGSQHESCRHRALHSECEL